MKYPNILTASICLACASGFSNVALAEDAIPIELLNLAKETGVEMHAPLAAIVSKYPLAGKTLTLTGKLSISGRASYKGHSFAFAAPGNKKAVQTVTYIFGEAQADGAIPFHLNHPYGNFDGIMTPVKKDQYKLSMNDVQGSMLSSLVYYASQSGNEWKNTSYSYTAVATQKKVKKVATTFVEIKEKASFRITIPTLTGAVANYTYSYDWKAAVQ